MKWEYKRVPLDFWLGGELEEEPLNLQGEEGWEAFHIQQIGNDERNQYIFFKRPKLTKKEKENTRDIIERMVSQLMNKENK